MRKFVLASVLAIAGALGAAATPASAQVLMSREQIQFYTPEWRGERFPDGRPKISDDLVRRAANISLEEAWGTLRANGYNNQFDSGWESLHPDQVIVGRALTAQYMPMRPDMNTVLSARAEQLRRWDNKSNIWPIRELQPGDIYVADGYGKIVDGTLIGDILGNSIYAASRNGFIFDGSVRDVEGLSEIEGFNGYYRDADPSAIREMQMVAINGPIRIGRATVLPGDLVIAKFDGVVFIPAHLAELVVTQSEFIMLRDAFGHEAVRTGQFGPQDIDTQWNATVRAAFMRWVEQHPDRMPMSQEQFREVLRRNNWDSSDRPAARPR